MKIMRLAVVLCAAVVLAACLPVTSDEPIGSTVGMTVDSELLGVWRFTPNDGKDVIYFHFLRQQDESISAVLVEVPADNNDSRWGVYSVQTTTLGGNHFANVRAVLAQGKPVEGEEARMFPVLYRIDGSRLFIYLIDEHAAAAAVEAGKVSGETSGSDVRITADAKASDAFFTSVEGAALFSAELGSFAKVE